MAEPKIRLSSGYFGEREGQPTPAVLYHYTDQMGLLGILESGELWATKLQFMNDTTEFRLAITTATERLTHRTRTANDFDHQVLRNVLEHLDGIEMINIFAVSFCVNGGLLSQWRGYTSTSVGYAIGLSSTALLAVGGGCRLAQCIYSAAEQTRIVDDLIDDTLRQASKYDDTVEANLVLSSAFEQAIIEYGAFFKDTSFREEDEWRLVTPVRLYRDPNLNFRAGKSFPIPYYRLSVASDSWTNIIEDIVVGPCPHPEASIAALKGILFHFGVNRRISSLAPIGGRDRPPVRLSAIPYRNW